MRMSNISAFCGGGMLCLALASCGNDTTQPNPTAEPNPTAPEFTIVHNTWITRRDMPYERWGLAVADVPNAAGQSILYAIGGQTATGTPLGRVQAYNVATNTWTWKASLPLPLSETNGAGVINGKICISAGLFDENWAYHGLFNGLLMYDPATNTWTRKQAMPDWGAWGVTGVINGKLYVVSACTYAPPSTNWYDTCDPSNFFRYNPVTNRWITLPSPRGSYRQGGVLYDKLYVTNGTTLEVYDPATNEWTRKPQGGRSGSVAVALGAELYVIGDKTNVYHPLTDTWTTAASPPHALSDVAATRVFLNGQARIEVVGGSLPGNHLEYIP